VVVVLSVIAGALGGRAFTDWTMLDEVKAQRFVVVDDTGKTRAVFGMTPEHPVISLMDSAARPRCVLTQGALVFRDALDAAETQRVLIGYGDDSGIFQLYDGNNVLRLTMGLTGNGVSLFMYDEHKRRMFATSAANDVAQTHWFARNNAKATVMTDSDTASIATSGTDGRITWSQSSN